MKYARNYKWTFTMSIAGDNGTRRQFDEGERFITIPWYGAEGAYMSLEDGSIITFEEVTALAHETKRKLMVQAY